MEQGYCKNCKEWVNVKPVWKNSKNAKPYEASGKYITVCCACEKEMV